METTDEYRLSHTAVGKGASYQESFEKYPYRRLMWTWEKKQIKEIITYRFKKEKDILDFACGTGRILLELANISENVTGIDVSESMLDVARKRVPNTEIINADITHINPFEEKKQFQIIVSFRFFLNAQQTLRKEVLSALTPMLEDDGVLIFNNHGNSSHLGLFPKKLSRKQIDELLECEGLKIVETYHRNVWPIMSEKRERDVSKFETLENWFSKRKFFERLSRNVIYVCKKKS